MDVKIKLVYYNQVGNIDVESVWSKKEGEFYRIKNIPFFASNLSYNDLVKVDEEDGELFFDELVEPSGHSTLQIIFFDEKIISQVTAYFIEQGCSWEGSHKKNYISVDVPADIKYNNIKGHLDVLELEKKLSYKEACLAHKL